MKSINTRANIRPSIIEVLSNIIEGVFLTGASKAGNQLTILLLRTPSTIDICVYIFLSP